MTFPRTEAETIALFRLASARLGWKITHLQTAFPDAVIENGRGQQLVVEFEFDSKNFHAHGHDPAGCDLVVCWHDGWENPPVPVWALEGCAGEEASIIRPLLRGKIHISELIKEQQRYNALQDEFSKTKAELLSIKQNLPLEKIKWEYQVKRAERKKAHEAKLAQIEREYEIKLNAIQSSSITPDWTIPVGYAILGMSFIIALPAAISLVKYLINNGLGG